MPADWCWGRSPGKVSPFYRDGTTITRGTTSGKWYSRYGYWQAWGFGSEAHLTNEDLIRERYQGIRPAPGYPAQPDHTEKLILWDLLEVEETTGIRLTESMAMMPAASVCSLCFGHPESRYFAGGRIGADQAQAYAGRKGWSQAEAERWVSA